MEDRSQPFHLGVFSYVVLKLKDSCDLMAPGEGGDGRRKLQQRE